MGLFDKWFPKESYKAEYKELVARSAPLDGVIPASYSEFVLGDPKQVLRLPVVYRSIQIIANMASQLELEVFDGKRKVDSPPIIRKPDVNQPTALFIRQIVTELATYGECFLRVYFDGRGAASSLDILPTSSVGVTKENGRIKYSYNGQSFNQKQIKHLKLFALADDNDLHGKGPIQASKSIFELALLLEQYAMVQFDSDAIPRGKLTTNQEINPEDLAELAQGVKEFIQNNGGILALTHGLDYEPIVGDPTKTQFIDVQNMVNRMIAAVFGVPAEALLLPGEGSSMTYQNVSQSNIRFLQNTLSAYLNVIEVHLSEFLTGNKQVRFREDDLLRLDTKGKWEVIEIQDRVGYTSGDELRREEGKEPLPSEPNKELKKVDDEI